MKHLLACTALACATLCAALPAHAAPATLSDCRALPDANARLACYDALPLPSSTAAATQPVAPAAPAAAPPPAQEPAGGWFGLSRPTAAEKEIASTVPGHFTGWHKGTVFKLANGQVWQATDDDSTYYEADDPKVTIKPGMLGAYLLTVEGLGISLHVRRLQ